MYTRRIICLANSYKHGGRCVAGRVYRDGSVGEWVRPVSVREGRELSPAECRYGLLRGEVSVGDIVDVQLAKPVPNGHQVENHEIACTGAWRKAGCATWTLLYACQDVDCQEFWADRGRSSRGMADRVPVSVSTTLGASLQWIYLPHMELLVRAGFSGVGKEVRACFVHLGQEYRLKVTDPEVCNATKANPPGRYPVGMALLCVSISEPYDGFVYRLVATIITPRRCESFRQ
jgi:hypothetical protein